jgi:hypothetical protein
MLTVLLAISKAMCCTRCEARRRFCWAEPLNTKGVSSEADDASQQGMPVDDPACGQACGLIRLPLGPRVERQQCGAACSKRAGIPTSLASVSSYWRAPSHF